MPRHAGWLRSVASDDGSRSRELGAERTAYRAITAEQPKQAHESQSEAFHAGSFLEMNRRGRWITGGIAWVAGRER